MDLERFREEAARAFDAVPAEFKEGVEGVVVRPEAVPHPDLPGIYTLGECRTESYASAYEGPETTRSVVILYYGSFRALAAGEPGPDPAGGGSARPPAGGESGRAPSSGGSFFDWEGEIWETLTHELRHHLESLAGTDELEGVDYAMDERFKREQGLGFDPSYYRSGLEVSPGLFQMEDHYVLEQSWREEDFLSVSEIRFTVGGRCFRIPRPRELGDVHFVRVTGVLRDDVDFQLALVRRRRWWREALRGAGGSRPRIVESESRGRECGDLTLD